MWREDVVGMHHLLWVVDMQGYQRVLLAVRLSQWAALLESNGSHDQELRLDRSMPFTSSYIFQYMLAMPGRMAALTKFNHGLCQQPPCPSSMPCPFPVDLHEHLSHLDLIIPISQHVITANKYRKPAQTPAHPTVSKLPSPLIGFHRTRN